MQAAVRGEPPFITKCLPSKKFAEYPGIKRKWLKSWKRRKGVRVHSQPFPSRSATPKSLAPGYAPIGTGPSAENQNSHAGESGAAIPRDRRVPSPLRVPQAARCHSASLGNSCPPIGHRPLPRVAHVYGPVQRQRNFSEHRRESTSSPRWNPERGMVVPAMIHSQPLVQRRRS